MPTEGKDLEIHMTWSILKDKQTSAHIQNSFLKIYRNLKIQILKVSPKLKKKSSIKVIEYQTIFKKPFKMFTKFFANKGK